jgi:tetratricopeptide (TPR) repeat protein
MSKAVEKPTVFISYSHKDEEWKDRLRPHLKMLEQAERIRIWDDRDIDAGAQWYNDIMQAMNSAAVAVCLISADFLASDFCTKEEIPYLLGRRERDGMLLLPILVRPCVWKVATWLEKTQMLPRDGKSVTKDFKGNEDEVFALVAETIFDKLDNPNYQPPAPPPPRWSPPERVEISRLPMTGAELFGRQRELEMLDEAWASDSTHVVSLVAWGGVGKSTLVKKWLERLAADNYRGARRVYAWSFYSQGTSERVTSADLFINDALTWFGDADPTLGSPWDKGERLARLVREDKTLLLLDGLEPLQSGLAYERGKIKDPALSTLLAELARSNPGLCVITTREAVTDLAEFPDTVLHKDLEQISDEAGRALLRVGGNVQGTDAELEQATRDFGNHALAINLLAVYLHGIPGHRISHAVEIPDLDLTEAEGKHPRRLMAAFEHRFGPGPEVELLRMLGLFNRPADKPSLDALRAEPAIPNLTEYIQKLSEADWLKLIEKLRRTKLIAHASQHRPDDLDAHPLVREHFGQQLKHDHPDAWREGNDRLYEHLKNRTKEFPDTVEEMTPLYAAVAHGCAAGRHQEALIEVYYGRICRGEAFFNMHKLGAYGADMAALASFFDPPWQKPVLKLTDKAKAFILGFAGVCLRALGRLTEAVQPLQAGLEARISLQDWANASVTAGNLSQLYLTLGDLRQAVAYAEQRIELADKSGDSLRRMVGETTLADALSQAGRLPEAEETFQKAELMQQDYQPQNPLLYSLRGFLYCDLLLEQGKYVEVESRAYQTLQVARRSLGLLSIALDLLSLGRAYLLRAREGKTGDYAQATEQLNQAVDGLRLAGDVEFLSRGLLARAELYTVKGDFSRARDDLGEALSIAVRGEMRLHEADCRLGYARLFVAQGEMERARESWGKAKEMIERMGYGRRNKDVKEIGQQLGGMAGE